MKKSAVLFLVMFLSVTGFAQVKLGLRLAPGLAVNSVIGDDTFDAAETNGASVRFSAGPIADFFFADNYAISTGLWYTVKRGSFRGFRRAARRNRYLPGQPDHLQPTNDPGSRRRKIIYQ
jgi:hypothetical protein